MYNCDKVTYKQQHYSTHKQCGEIWSVEAIKSYPSKGVSGKHEINRFKKNKSVSKITK